MLRMQITGQMYHHLHHHRRRHENETRKGTVKMKTHRHSSQFHFEIKSILNFYRNYFFLFHSRIKSRYCAKILYFFVYFKLTINWISFIFHRNSNQIHQNSYSTRVNNNNNKKKINKKKE